MKNDLPTDFETDIWVAMNRATRRIQSDISAALKEAGLPPLKWYDVLWSLERHGGQLRPFELAQDTIFEQSNLSHLSKRIAAEGLVEFVELGSDRRGKVLKITAKGRDVRKRMWSIYGPMLHDRMRTFGKADGWQTFIEAEQNQSCPN
ncbi:MarR family winged helix-turn-helix transcriptional regulator [uncultured Ruegeria sp.]|uniref:MarR family winged helix-turn-helix transcriptional regulator n=1 Tax=uncultured Ruegeria sp. TaxID=259304 RepID=UPI00260CC5C7|nr:MarR family winged helix-turn-helix transcriptional regulator [uncultured Ruegeria sp.]